MVKSRRSLGRRLPALHSGLGSGALGTSGSAKPEPIVSGNAEQTPAARVCKELDGALNSRQI